MKTPIELLFEPDFSVEVDEVFSPLDAVDDEVPEVEPEVLVLGELVGGDESLGILPLPGKLVTGGLSTMMTDGVMLMAKVFAVIAKSTPPFAVPPSSFT
jgi:hypothetical protein